MRIRPFLTLALAFASVAPASAQGPPAIRDGSFVAAAGHQFVLDGAPFHVVGANVAVMHGPEHRGAMNETLEAAAQDGLSVVRLWALGEYPESAPPWARQYAFRIGPEGWIDESYVHLDRVLARARALGLRVIVVLANRWGDYGGITQYLRWIGIEPPTVTVPPAGLSPFYEDARSEALYRAHVERLVRRVNSVTGVAYVDDPTIFAWELINEAEAATSSGETAMLRWMERQAGHIHNLDPNHMVSAGHIGYERLRDRALWQRACAIEGIAYCDSHAYPISAGRVRTPGALARWIDDRVQLAQHVVGKPLLFGELGVRTDRRGMHGRDRVAWLNAFFRRVFDDGAAGAMLWTYLPSFGRRREFGVYVEGDRERQTVDMRRALALHARAARRRAPRSINGALSRERGDAPIFDPTVRLLGPATLHRRTVAIERGVAVTIDPLAFERARFEATGAWAGDPGLPHFYGAGAGRVSYRLIRPRAARGAIGLRVRMRASSELPGAGGGATEADTTTLTIALEGAELGRVVAPPDDGIGGTVEVTFDDRRAIARLGNTLRLTIDAGAEGAGGVCIYGANERGEPTPIEVAWILEATESTE